MKASLLLSIIVALQAIKQPHIVTCKTQTSLEIDIDPGHILSDVPPAYAEEPNQHQPQTSWHRMIDPQHMHGNPSRISPPKADVPVDYQPPQQQGYLKNMQFSNHKGSPHITNMMLYKVLILMASTYTCPNKQPPTTAPHSGPVNYNSTQFYNKCPSPCFTMSDHNKQQAPEDPYGYTLSPTTIGSAREELQLMINPASHNGNLGKPPYLETRDGYLDKPPYLETRDYYLDKSPHLKTSGYLAADAQAPLVQKHSNKSAAHHQPCNI